VEAADAAPGSPKETTTIKQISSEATLYLFKLFKRLFFFTLDHPLQAIKFGEIDFYLLQILVENPELYLSRETHLF
jgi:hypothetical protein